MTMLLNRRTDTPAAAPPESARRWAYASAVSATAGFIPLHLVWALGIPLGADPDRFAAWHADGGGAYLFALNALAVLPAVLAMALVRPWGLRFPAWVPGLAGRPAPRLPLIVAGYAVSAFLFAYTAFAAALTPVQWNAPEAIFEPWTGVYGIAQFIVWAVGLTVATRSYARRTAQRSGR